MKPFKRNDFLRKINSAKNYSEFEKWLNAYNEYMSWINGSKDRLFKHFKVPITLKDI